MKDLPLVSCIMPTRNRTGFVVKAIDCFLKQDYPNKQLFICEEESSSKKEVLYATETFAEHKSITYLRYPNTIYKSIGEKRNAMCELVQGELIAHWDDDDWHSPKRLSTQINKMRAEGARLCGQDQLVFYTGERAYLFDTVREPWLAGGTLVYEKSLWKEQPFTEVSNGEDVAFVDAAYMRNVKIATIDDHSLYVARLHADNTTKRDIDDVQWGGFDVETVRGWMGENNART